MAFLFLEANFSQLKVAPEVVKELLESMALAIDIHQFDVSSLDLRIVTKLNLSYRQGYHLVGASEFDRLKTCLFKMLNALAANVDTKSLDMLPAPAFGKQTLLYIDSEESKPIVSVAKVGDSIEMPGSRELTKDVVNMRQLGCSRVWVKSSLMEEDEAPLSKRDVLHQLDEWGLYILENVEIIKVPADDDTPRQYWVEMKFS